MKRIVLIGFILVGVMATAIAAAVTSTDAPPATTESPTSSSEQASTVSGGSSDASQSTTTVNQSSTAGVTTTPAPSPSKPSEHNTAVAMGVLFALSLLVNIAMVYLFCRMRRH